MNSNKFHALNGISNEEKRADNVRELVGDGSPFLKAPGLITVIAVRVGTMVLEDFTQKVPTDATLKNFEDEDVQMVHLDHTADGTPVLLRNIQSNDGLWQNGVSVYIAGEWEAEAPAATEEEAAPAK